MKLLVLLLLPLFLSAYTPDCKMMTSLGLWHADKAMEQSTVDCKQLIIAIKQLHVVEATCPPIDLPSLTKLLEQLHKKDCK